jgi:hypothetical protein
MSPGRHMDFYSPNEVNGLFRVDFLTEKNHGRIISLAFSGYLGGVTMDSCSWFNRSSGYPCVSKSGFVATQEFSLGGVNPFLLSDGNFLFLPHAAWEIFVGLSETNLDLPVSWSGGMRMIVQLPNMGAFIALKMSGYFEEINRPEWADPYLSNTHFFPSVQLGFFLTESMILK